jgi:CBS domain-containing protein
VQVKDIMTLDPACCLKHSNLTDVARVMRDRDCGAIPVVESDATGNKVIGIITDRDIVVRAVADGTDPSQLTAGDCMSMVVATVLPEASMEKCANLMEQHQVRRIPVVDAKGECCGLVAQADLARHAPPPKTAEVLREVSQPAEASKG